MAEQHIEREITYTEPRWKPDAGTEKTTTMIEAQFATGDRHNFEEWELEAIDGMAYPKSKLVQFRGAWYTPEHLQDEIHDENTK